MRVDHTALEWRVVVAGAVRQKVWVLSVSALADSVKPGAQGGFVNVRSLEGGLPVRGQSV